MKRPAPDEVILGLLKAQPAHGYELLDYFRSPSQLGWIWTMSTSQLYAVLKRLNQEGAIIGKDLDMPNAPQRVQFTVSEDGDQQLVKWLFDPLPSASIHRIRVLFLSRVYIANLLGTPLDKIVTAQITSCQVQRDKFSRQLNLAKSNIEKLTLDFVVRQLETAITWLKHSEFKLPGHVNEDGQA